jgi:hypothetical protein
MKIKRITVSSWERAELIAMAAAFNSGRTIYTEEQGNELHISDYRGLLAIVTVGPA